MARGFVQTLILLVLAYAVFRMFTPVSFASSLLIVLVFSAAGAALRLLIAAVARSEDAANWIAIVLTMYLVMLGGTFFEASEGSILYTLGWTSLNTYANEALRGVIAEGASLGEVALPLAILAAVTLVGLVISRLLFKAVPGGK